MNVTHQFESVEAVRSALYHELESENIIPDTKDFSLGYFEG